MKSKLLKSMAKKAPGLFPVSFLALSAGAGLSGAATVNAFWAAQGQTPGTETITGPSGALSASTFPVAPSLSRTGTATLNNGGAASFTDFQGRIWTGSGNQNTPGHSFGWGPGATNASLTVTLDMRDIQDLTLRMDIRSAGNNGATPLSAFSAIEYSVDGAAFVPAATGSSLGFTTGIAFNPFTLDLSSLSDIEGRNEVRLRFSLPASPSDTSIRLDNIQITAQSVPEPASLAVLMLGAATFMAKRRRA